MNGLKILFVGIGSIAKRHINNIYSIGIQNNICITIDAFRRSGDAVEGVRQVYQDVSNVPDDYDAIFITNPTELHLSALRQFHTKGQSFFIEKPIVSVNQLEEVQNFSLRDGVIYYVACPLRYNAVIQYIKQNIDSSDVLSVRSISSSYLPDWRPGQDYRETYSAKKELGGGVSIDLIHEWDYLTYLFGWPNKIKGMMGKKSELEIDSEDYAIYIAEYSDKIIELHLDYFGRKTIREIQIITKEDTIIGDIANNKLLYLKSGKHVDFHEERDDFQKRELCYFFDLILNKTEYHGGFEHGIDVLKLTQMRYIQ